MDLQTRKLAAIGYLINIQEERFFEKIEATFKDVSSKNEPSLKPITKNQLIDRANRSEDDYLAGRFKTQDQLEQESENWRK